MKVALIHDHLTQVGGAEKVLKVFSEIFPRAPIYTLIYDRKKISDFSKKEVITSFLQKIPGILKRYQWFLLLMPYATESYDLKDYDLVLSNSSAFAKGVITHSETLHICYCHTPTRYLWSDSHRYIEELSYYQLIKKIIPLFLPSLRLWDRLAAERVDKFIANSQNVRQRIWKYYRHESHIIHPPAEIDHFQISPEVGNYYLTGGRLVAYKRFDLVISAFNKLNIPLKIFGIGPSYLRLKEMAKPNIEFLGEIKESDKAKVYSQALAFIHPQEEDFGLTAVESMAAGRPVIAYKKGGALETIKEGLSGTFFIKQQWEELADTVIRFRPEKFNPHLIRDEASKFSTNNFKEKIKEYIKQTLKEFKK